MLRTRLWMGALLILLAASVLFLDPAPLYPLWLALLGLLTGLAVAAVGLPAGDAGAAAGQLARPPAGRAGLGRTRPLVARRGRPGGGGPGGVRVGDGHLPRAGRLGPAHRRRVVGRGLPRLPAVLPGPAPLEPRRR